MRALILVAAAALSLTGCKNNDQHDNTMNVDENLTAENIVSNDVTAIDAVTGDAANMAADVDMNYGNLDENSAGPTATMPVSKPKKLPSGEPSPTPETVTGNTTTNAVSNSQ
jgi:hypothetical protein